MIFVFEIAEKTLLLLLIHQPFNSKNIAKSRVSLTAPNRNHFARVSLTGLDIFLDAIAKAKKLMDESIAQNLKQVSLMGLDIILDAIAKAKKLIDESIAQNLKHESLTKEIFSFVNGI